MHIDAWCGFLFFSLLFLLLCLFFVKTRKLVSMQIAMLMQVINAYSAVSLFSFFSFLMCLFFTEHEHLPLMTMILKADSDA